MAAPPGDIAVPAVVVYELEMGIANSTRPGKRRGQLDEFLTLTTVLPWDRAAARRAAEFDAVLTVEGNRIGPLDTSDSRDRARARRHPGHPQRTRVFARERVEAGGLVLTGGAA